MGQRDTTLPTHYARELQALLSEPLALSLPEHVLEFAARRAFARGLEPREAAICICHEHSRRLCQRLVEQGDMASDLLEFAIATRIEGCAELAKVMDHELLDLLPDLPYFVRQSCFSPEFRDMVARIAFWHGIAEHRWSAPEDRADLSRRLAQRS